MRKYKFLMMLFLSSMSVSADTIKTFVPGSYQAILDIYKDKPFLMVFWSLDCPPCVRELTMLGELRKKKTINLVLISTDDGAAQKELVGALEHSQLQQADTWIFSSGQVQRLRYEIDPQWYGELPRSYLFDNKHNRRAISGVLTASLIMEWSAD